jgi:tRNA modification GTPase
MAYNPYDAIAAIATAAGGAARGIVRMSGPQAMEIAGRSFRDERGLAVLGASRSRRIRGVVRCGEPGEAPLDVPGELLVWPGPRSYTCEPAVEFHTIASPPLLAAALAQFCRDGARPAREGEFTLRAFLAGRIDLTQAEAVLGVVDARGPVELDAALTQLAGGLATPLRTAREQLMDLLAETEAALDFADEDLQFVSPQELRRRIEEAENSVRRVLDQLRHREADRRLPRVVLAGPTNAGKSSLFNSILAACGAAATPALVSPQPGATRDYLVAQIRVGGVACELVDTAGSTDEPSEIDRAALKLAARQRDGGDVLLLCRDEREARAKERIDERVDLAGPRVLLVETKSDLREPECAARATVDDSCTLACSAATGAGIPRLLSAVADALRRSLDEASHGAYAALTAARSRSSLETALASLAAARESSCAGRGELLAEELRSAVTALGEVLGATCADDVLDRVFRQFCIGK